MDNIKNPNLARWLFTSVVKHFTVASEKIRMPLHLDRYDRNTDWAELRVGGPYISEPSKRWYTVDYNIDILITSFETNNLYKIHELTSHYASNFEAICCYKYGDGPDDDHSLIGALKLKDTPISIHNFNLIFPQVKFVRSSVEADFWLDYN